MNCCKKETFSWKGIHSSPVRRTNCVKEDSQYFELTKTIFHSNCFTQKPAKPMHTTGSVFGHFLNTLISHKRTKNISLFLMFCSINSLHSYEPGNRNGVWEGRSESCHRRIPCNVQNISLDSDPALLKMPRSEKLLTSFPALHERTRKGF